MRSLVTLAALFLALTQPVTARDTGGQAPFGDIPADKAVLVYERIDPTRLTVAVIKTAGVEHVSLIAPEADVHHLVNRLLDNLDPDRMVIASPDDLPDVDAETAHHLFMLMMHPLMDRLPEIDRLAIMADGVLADLPFDALLTAMPSTRLRTAETYSAFPWLRKRFAISRLTRMARQVDGDVTPSREKGGLLGFGNPALDLDRGFSLPALPEANLELASMHMSLHGRPGSIAVGAKASEARFKEALASSTDLAVLALATHGFGATDSEDGASLMLTHGDGEDGRLTAAEVQRLSFRADLVILSACSSGAGALVDAFVEAGGEHVMALRWPVLSDVARLVSTNLVNMTQRDAGLSHDLALSQAIDQLIDGGTSPHHGHPMVWAPFVLTTAAV